MKINDFDKDETMLRTVASMLAQEFAKLKRIDDNITIDVFNGLIPQDQLVSTFWPYLSEALAADGGNGICRADIGYSTVDGSQNIDMVHATNLTLTRITEEEHRRIQKENKERKDQAE